MDTSNNDTSANVLQQTNQTINNQNQGNDNDNNDDDDETSEEGRGFYNNILYWAGSGSEEQQR